MSNKELIERATLAAANARRIRHHLDPLASLPDDEIVRCIREEVMAALVAVSDATPSEPDQRVEAWDELVNHPFFESCFEGDGDIPLLDKMMAKLDGAVVPTPSEFGESATVADAPKATQTPSEWEREAAIARIRAKLDRIPDSDAVTLEKADVRAVLTPPAPDVPTESPESGSVAATVQAGLDAPVDREKLDDLVKRVQDVLGCNCGEYEDPNTGADGFGCFEHEADCDEDGLCNFARLIAEKVLPLAVSPAPQPPRGEAFFIAAEAERKTHAARGWSIEHDREHGPTHPLRLALDYLANGKPVKAGSLIMAAMELLNEQAPPAPARDEWEYATTEHGIDLQPHGRLTRGEITPGEWFDSLDSEDRERLQLVRRRPKVDPGPWLPVTEEEQG